MIRWDNQSVSVFDAMATHLLKQGRRSTRLVGGKLQPAYHGSDGLKSAVGVLIEDDYYHESLEGRSVEVLTLKRMAFFAGAELGVYSLDLLEAVEQIHDEVPPHRWAYTLMDFVYEHEGRFGCLSPTVIDKHLEPFAIPV